MKLGSPPRMLKKLGPPLPPLLESAHAGKAIEHIKGAYRLEQFYGLLIDDRAAESFQKVAGAGCCYNDGILRIGGCGCPSKTDEAEGSQAVILPHPHEVALPVLT